eukprot:2509864-Amphidinium_carterae.1
MVTCQGPAAPLGAHVVPNIRLPRGEQDSVCFAPNCGANPKEEADLPLSQPPRHIQTRKCVRRELAVPTFALGPKDQPCQQLGYTAQGRAPQSACTTMGDSVGWKLQNIDDPA